jgi:N-acetylglucosaminyldiphosphoundecaprenol N-acetyl-beta-D-mannosaminyltransferase
MSGPGASAHMSAGGESKMKRPDTPGYESRRILGIDFYAGDVEGAIDEMSSGGLLVVPAAPALKDIASNESYREALTNADVVIPDSAFMVLLWNWFERDSLKRLSGLKYLRQLLSREEVRAPGNTFWVMAGKASAEKNIQWLESRGIEVPSVCIYEAPMYGSEIDDPVLIERLHDLRVKHIVITIGGGTQERLGLYLKRNLNNRPAIHCIGAAIAFLSGDQVKIPDWADRFYLGWFFRCVSAPERYVPRYWSAVKLVPLLRRYRDQLPPLQAVTPPAARAEA